MSGKVPISSINMPTNQNLYVHAQVDKNDLSYLNRVELHTVNTLIGSVVAHRVFHALICFNEMNQGNQVHYFPNPKI